MKIIMGFLAALCLFSAQSAQAAIGGFWFGDSRFYSALQLKQAYVGPQPVECSECNGTYQSDPYYKKSYGGNPASGQPGLECRADISAPGSTSFNAKCEFVADVSNLQLTDCAQPLFADSQIQSGVFSDAGGIIRTAIRTVTGGNLTYLDPYTHGKLTITCDANTDSCSYIDSSACK